MKPSSLSLLLALGAVASLMGCQDRSVVAPDEGAVSPDELIATSAKVKPCDPWPACNSTGGTATVTLSEGMLGGPSEMSVPRDDAATLDLQGSIVVTTALSNAYDMYVDDLCSVYNPGNWSDEDLELVAREFKMFGLSPTAPDPAEWLGTRILVDKTNLGGASVDHMISLNYISGDETVGGVNLRVGGGMLFGLGDPTVTDTETDDGTLYTFSGGTARVQSRADRVKKRPAIECPLGVDDRIEVLVKIH